MIYRCEVALCQCDFCAKLSPPAELEEVEQMLFDLWRDGWRFVFVPHNIMHACCQCALEKGFADAHEVRIPTRQNWFD